MKNVLLGLSIAVIAAAGFLFVQPNQVGAATVPGCNLFNVDLSVGSTGADVVALQNMLIGKGLLVMPSGATMGYFGSLTKAALLQYQTQNGLPATGVFDLATRTVVNNQSCGVPSSSSAPERPSSAPRIASLSSFSGSVGSQLTIYGSGFAPTGNYVAFYVGFSGRPAGSVTGVSSANGTSLTVTVPNIVAGIYNVSVIRGNSPGFPSNFVTFIVTSSSQGGAPTISTIIPSSGRVGLPVIINGSSFGSGGFSPTASKVVFFPVLTCAGCSPNILDVTSRVNAPISIIMFPSLTPV